MLDLRFIRENPEQVKRAARDKGEAVDIDALLGLDEERRRLQTELDGLRNERNKASEEVARLKKARQDADALIEQTRELSADIKQQEQTLRELTARVDSLMVTVPNLPAEDVPVGQDERDNELVREWGEPKSLNFKPAPHWDLAKSLDIIDFERAAKIAGSGFALFKGDGARLERALINFMLDLHTSEHGYKEIFPPFVSNRASMTGTGQLPKLEEDMYLCEQDDLFLIPTAEVPITNFHRDEIIDRIDLPLCYAGYTACFRREAGSYGRDTRGLMRVHQFDKIELMKFVEPGTSFDELEGLLRNAETVIRKLGLPYRVMKLCTGELSFAACKCYDIEVWAPGIERWMEVSSCSTYLDFQARRCNIRYRDADGKPRFVHTLNGSGVALARTVLAIIETFQTQDGRVEIPEALRPYMGGQEFIS